MVESDYMTGPRFGQEGQIREVRMPDGSVKRYKAFDANRHPAIEAGNPRYAKPGFGEPPGGSILRLRR